jgi:hypothetical protein
MLRLGRTRISEATVFRKEYQMSTKTRERHHRGHSSNDELPEALVQNPTPVGKEVGAEDRFQSIQVRAYGLWEEAGRPGDDAARERFWCEAEKEFLLPLATEE